MSRPASPARVTRPQAESATPPGNETEDQQAERNLLKVAAGGFLIGVLLHVFVIYSVLGGSGSTEESPVRVLPNDGGATTVAASPTPNRLADRNSCDAIRGTDYRSETERQWFLRNCS